MAIEFLPGLAFLAEFNAQTALKLLIIALAAPLWWPVARALRNEVTEALAPEGGLFGNKQKRPMRAAPRGLDPFVSVPLAHHRKSTQQSHKKSPDSRQADLLTPKARVRAPGSGKAKQARGQRQVAPKRRGF